MTPEQDAPVLSIEHWNYQMAKDAGHPEMGELGMFVDVAVFKREGEVFRVQKVKELKIEWERFKRDEAYAAQIIKAAKEILISTP
jgi:hypothetical protein